MDLESLHMRRVGPCGLPIGIPKRLPLGRSAPTMGFCLISSSFRLLEGAAPAAGLSQAPLKSVATPRLGEALPKLRTKRAGSHVLLPKLWAVGSIFQCLLRTLGVFQLLVCKEPHLVCRHGLDLGEWPCVTHVWAIKILLMPLE